MEDLKIRVTTKQESKEAQELAVKAGYELDTMFGQHWNSEYSYLALCGDMSAGFATNDMVKNDKEITLPRLRDMVVLKRNDVNDATHTDQDGWKWYIGADSYVWQAGNSQQLKQWDQSGLAMVDLKPIEKEMKEYLDKDYVLRQVKQTSGDNRVPSDWIEVPEGANFYCDTYFWMQLNSQKFWNGVDWQYDQTTLLNFSKSFNKPILWQRESLNNKVASAEVARQDNVNNPSHYNKGGIECIDAIQSSMTKEAFCGYLKGNVQKYMWRYESKGGVESLQKAQWYLSKLIEVEAS